jgi:hypothetical protein
MQLLLKFPTKYRLEKSLTVIARYVEYATTPEKLQIVVSLDVDDAESIAGIPRYEAILPGQVQVCVGPAEGKIAAVNRDVPSPDTFDILLLGSDDMIPMVKGYDDVIRRKMAAYYPDTDGVLFFNDGVQGSNLNTLSIMGSKFYQRFGYIYCPEYKSFFCDTEFTEVATALGKQTYFPEIIIQHFNPHANKRVPFDDLYIQNFRHWAVDEATYNRRKAEGFFVSNKRIPGSKMKLQFI